jgi:heptosyltransferase-3
MRTEPDILSLAKAKEAQVARESKRGVILQSGALGDCILTLPLAKLMKRTLKLGGIDIIGHAEYVGMLPGRSCVDSIRSIESTDLHRLFVETAKFDLDDRDPLISTFSDYAWIVTFLGEADGNFERNLIFTAHCTHSAEICTLSMKPPEGSRQHVTQYYAQQFVEYSALPATKAKSRSTDVLIRATKADRAAGRGLLAQEGINSNRRVVVLHPGSGGRHKCWHIENFIRIAENLGAMRFEVLFLLGPAEMERLAYADTARLRSTAHCVANLPLSRVVALLSCAYGFVGNDSGVTHLAAGMGRRTIALFGPTDPVQYAPVGPALKLLHNPSEQFAHKPDPDLQKVVLDTLDAWLRS